MLPALLAASDLERPVLFGHSDGASIALICAGRYPNGTSALVLEAPHVFVEELTVTSIAQVRETLATSTAAGTAGAAIITMPETTFRGWNDIWLDPAFRAWDIRDYLPAITAPVLLIQGRDDEYGTLAQIEAIASALSPTETLLFEESGHSPHRTHPDEVAERSAAFLRD